MPSEIPRDAKTTSADLFQHAPTIRVAELPLDMPMLHRRRIASLLAFDPEDSYVSHLVYARRDASGTLVFGPEVQHHPWEWAESIEPRVPIAAAPHTRAPSVLRNSSSIPLERFGTQPTGERVAGSSVGASRQLEDGLAAESVFERDWRETRLDARADLAAECGCGEEARRDGADAGRQDGPPGWLAEGSPAPTGRSQRSSVASTRSQRASSVLSTASRGRSAGLDGERSTTGSSSMRGAKRKASPASVELEPPAAPARGGRRARGRGAGTGRGKAKKK